MLAGPFLFQGCLMTETMNRLGQCERCRAQLCTKGDVICCSVCGLPVPEHPLAVKPVVGVADHAEEVPAVKSNSAAVAHMAHKNRK